MYLSIIFSSTFRSVFISDFIKIIMSDKKASANTTSATKKASAAAKTPAAAAPAAPKAEV